MIGDATTRARSDLAQYRGQAGAAKPLPWDLLGGVLSAECTLTSAERLILLRLWKHADDDLIAWPGVRLLAAETGVSARSTRRALANLERLNYIGSYKRRGTTSIFDLKPNPVALLIAASKKRRADRQNGQTPATQASPERADVNVPDCRSAAIEAAPVESPVTSAGNPGHTGQGVWPPLPGSVATVIAPAAKCTHECSRSVNGTTQCDQAPADTGEEENGTSPQCAPDRPPPNRTPGEGSGDDKSNGLNHPTPDQVARQIQQAAESGMFELHHRNMLLCAADLQRERRAYAANETIRLVERETGKERLQLGLPLSQDMYQAASVSGQP